MRIFGQNKIGIITTIARPTQARSSPQSDHSRWVWAILFWDLHSIRSGTRSPQHLPDLHVLTCAEMADISHTSYTCSGSTHTSCLTCLADRSHTSPTLLLHMLRRLCVGPLAASPPHISLSSHPCSAIEAWLSSSFVIASMMGMFCGAQWLSINLSLIHISEPTRPY